MTCSSYCACFGGVSGKTRIERSFITLYESWFIVMICFSACSSVTPSSCTVVGAVGGLAVVGDVDAGALAMKFRMSRRLALVNRSRAARATSGSAAARPTRARARSRSCLDRPACGRAASIRSRMRLVERRHLRGRPARLLGSYSAGRLVLAERRLELVLLLELLRLSRCAREAASMARSSAIL